MLFAKFVTPVNATSGLKVLTDMFAKENVDKERKEWLWGNFDLPLEQRVANSFLFALRRKLVDWKMGEKYIKVDPDLGALTAGGKPVVKARTINNVLVLDWADQKWAPWSELQSSDELKDLRQKAADRLVRG